MDGVSLNNPQIGGVGNSWGCGEQKFILGYGEQKVWCICRIVPY